MKDDTLEEYISTSHQTIQMMNDSLKRNMEWMNIQQGHNKLFLECVLDLRKRIEKLEEESNVG